METLKEKIAYCDFVRFTLSDVHGCPKGKCIHRDCVPRFLQEGVGFYSGVQCLGPRGQLVHVKRGSEDYGNIMSRPMPDTFHILPWAGSSKYKVGEVLCETEWSPTEKMGISTRSLARRLIERLKAECDGTIKTGWEYEFYVLDKASQKPLFEGIDFASTLLLSEHEDYFLDLVSQLNEAGIGVEGVAAEYGPGQVELATIPINDIAAGDTAFNLKEAVKEITTQHGLQATFMSKPFPSACGSGLHFNFSMTDQKGRNIFLDLDSEDKLSDVARHFIAGLITHSSAITALSCPTYNCYRRLHCPWAPGKVTWGVENRQSFLRVKYGPDGPFMESRVPSAAANPYLVMASHLAAGLDGVAKKTECPPPMDKSAPDLPHHLQEALQGLEDDKELCQVLGDEFIEWFLTEKRTVELEELKNCDLKATSAEALKKEFDMYFKFI